MDARGECAAGSHEPPLVPKEVAPRINDGDAAAGAGPKELAPPVTQDLPQEVTERPDVGTVPDRGPEDQKVLVEAFPVAPDLEKVDPPAADPQISSFV